MGGFEQAAMVVRAPVTREEGMQESDLLDMLPDGQAKADDRTDHITLVSLGCFCGPKLSFKHIGRGAETLPFDWMRTCGAALLKFMRNDFEGFFDFDTKKPVPACNMTTYRTHHHSFWHDDPGDPGMRVRYNRRIARFKNLESGEKPILFVRTIATTDEIAEVPELRAEIVTRYGKNACLLIVIDFQATAPGPAIVDGLENLLIYYLTGSHHVGDDGSPTPPYGKPVLCALDWMVGRPIEARRFPDIAKVAACADETHWGLQGLGGLNAFESTEGGPLSQEEPLELVPPDARPVRAPPLLSAELETRLGAARQPAADGVTLVSLGCSPATKMSMQELGFGSEELPFDWTHVSHEGLLHFLHKGLDAPIREGLGAGGQRPSETHGYLDIAVRGIVPGTAMPVCRSHLHSFWHDDLGDPETRAALAQRVRRWASLGQPGAPLLFVRAVASSAELGRADELLSALTKRFGRSACLLLIADFQEANVGPLIVEGLDDLLVYFLSGDAHEAGAASAPYRKPIECALGWLRGEPLEASSVEGLGAVQGLATATNWGLVGPGGLHAFEGVSRAPEEGGDELEPSPATIAENAWLEEAKFEAAKDSFAMLSLGSHPGVAWALQHLSLGAEEGPFDTLHICLDGVVHFLRTAFRDFFDVAPELPVPGTSMMLRRSCRHCFCDEFPQESWQQAYQQALDSWWQLSRSSRPKMFVYAIQDADELDQLPMALEELMVHFGRHIFLAAILGGQEQARTVSMDGNYNLLVHFITEGVGAAADPVHYIKPLRTSLDWAVGKPLKVTVVPELAALKSLAVPARAEVVGPGGLPLFEDCAAVEDIAALKCAGAGGTLEDSTTSAGSGGPAPSDQASAAISEA